MTAAELQQWWVLYQIEPWGEKRADLRMAIQTAAMVRMWASDPSKITANSFMPDFYREFDTRRKQPTPERTARAFKTLALLGVGTMQEG